MRMQVRGLWCIEVRQVVIAITLTPVRHKRHMNFLTSAPNFSWTTDPAFPSPDCFHFSYLFIYSLSYRSIDIQRVNVCDGQWNTIDSLIGFIETSCVLFAVSSDRGHNVWLRSKSAESADLQRRSDSLPRQWWAGTGSFVEIPWRKNPTGYDNTLFSVKCWDRVSII